MDIIKKWDGVTKSDICVGAGGNVGYFSVMLSPFVKKVFNLDYAENLIKLSTNLIGGVSNVESYVDDVRELQNLSDKTQPWDKYHAGSLLHHSSLPKRL